MGYRLGCDRGYDQGVLSTTEEKDAQAAKGRDEAMLWKRYIVRDVGERESRRYNY